jgi:hypothetical protein
MLASYPNGSSKFLSPGGKVGSDDSKSVGGACVTEAAPEGFKFCPVALLIGLD